MSDTYAVRRVDEREPERSGFFYLGDQPSGSESLLHESEQAEYYQQFSDSRPYWRNHYEVIDLQTNEVMYTTARRER
jgi:hypothetical protein